MPAQKCVLVTVGTTKFDDLIRGVDSVDVVWTFKLKGYDKLVVQHGNGVYKIQHIFPSPVQGFEVEYDPMMNLIPESCPGQRTPSPDGSNLMLLHHPWIVTNIAMYFIHSAHSALLQ
jgi:hypothetical protein